jgi:predicted ABC-type ATPase/GNAT superfamily N-acetyltransferase
LIGVQLSTKGHHRGSFPIEWGTDRQSYLRPERFIQVDASNYRKEGAYVKKPKFQEIVDTISKQHGLTTQVFVSDVESFACHDASCRPPTSGGTGGSTPGIAGIKMTNGQPLTRDVLMNAHVGFIQIAEASTLSGYKAHIFADNVDDVEYILRRIKPYLASEDNPDGLAAKVATNRFFDLTEGEHPQHGKAVTVYFQKRDTWKKELDGLVRDMEDLPSRMHKTITGDDYAGNGVSWRYELSGDPGRDLDPREYHDWYQAAFAAEVSLTSAALTEALACHDASCRPPTSGGTGGSSKKSTVGFGGQSLPRTNRVQPKHLITSLDKHTMDALDIGDPDLPTKKRSEQFIASWYKPDNLPEGYSVEVKVHQIGADYFSVNGVVKNQYGRRVGDFERTIDFDPVTAFEDPKLKNQWGGQERTFIDGAVVSHDSFHLDGDAQGKGIGEALNARAVEAYQRYGIDHVKVNAGHEVGGYAWAVAGFRIDDGQHAHAMAAKDYGIDRHEYATYFASKGSDTITRLQDNAELTIPQAKLVRKELEALTAASARGDDVQPVHFASIGERDMRFTKINAAGEEYETWPGKEIMLGTTWPGTYYFGEALTASAVGVVELYSALQRRDKRGRWTKGGGHSVSVSVRGNDPKCNPKPCVTESIERDTMARRLLQRRIVNETLAGGTPPPTLTILGGGGGAGKTSSSAKLGLTREHEVTINADDIKEKIPEYDALVKRGDVTAAAFVHEESSKIGKDAQVEARQRGVGVTLDQVGSNPKKVADQVEAFVRAGYDPKEIQAVYVTTSTDEAYRRAVERGKKKGRVVPEEVLRAAHRDVSRGFEEIAAIPSIGTIKLIDNNGKDPILVAEGGGGKPLVIHDQTRYDEFLAKGEE